MKNQFKFSDWVYVDFTSQNSTETDGTQVKGIGLIRKVDPDGFIYGTINGNFNKPFACAAHYAKHLHEIFNIGDIVFCTHWKSQFKICEKRFDSIGVEFVLRRLDELSEKHYLSCRTALDLKHVCEGGE